MALRPRRERPSPSGISPASCGMRHLDGPAIPCRAIFVVSLRAPHGATAKSSEALERIVRVAPSIGLVMQSYAPMRMACTALSIVPCAVTRMTAIVSACSSIPGDQGRPCGAFQYPYTTVDGPPLPPSPDLARGLGHHIPTTKQVQPVRSAILLIFSDIRTFSWFICLVASLALDPGPTGDAGATENQRYGGQTSSGKVWCGRDG